MGRRNQGGGDAGGPKRKLRLDVTSLRNNNNSDEESGGPQNPLLQLLGDYSDDEQNPSTTTTTNTNNNNNNGNQADNVDLEVDNFLDQLEVITGETLRPADKSSSTSNAKLPVAGEVLLPADSVWRACKDPGSGDTYYWNTSTGEVTWDLPPQPPVPTVASTSKISKDTSLPTSTPTAMSSTLSTADNNSTSLTLTKNDKPVDETSEPAAKKQKLLPETQDKVEAIHQSENNGESSNPSADDDITSLLDAHKADMVTIHQDIQLLIKQIKAKVFDIISIGNEVKSSLLPDQSIGELEFEKIFTEFETRVSDWVEGGMRDEFVVEKFRKTYDRLKPIFGITEEKQKNGNNDNSVISGSSMPVGWCKLLDSTGSQHYYANILTGESSWEWPPPTSGPAAVVYAAAPVKYNVQPSDDALNSLLASYSNEPAPPPPPLPEDDPTPPSTSSSLSQPKPPAKRVKASTGSYSKMNNLISKWQSANQELHKREESPEKVVEVKKTQKQQIDEWKADQIKSGESNHNPNFQPIAVDWRERVERARKIRDSNLSS